MTVARGVGAALAVLAAAAMGKVLLQQAPDTGTAGDPPPSPLSPVPTPPAAPRWVEPVGEPAKVVEARPGDTAPDRSEVLRVRALGPDGTGIPRFWVHATYEENGIVLAKSDAGVLKADGTKWIAFKWEPGTEPVRPIFDPLRGRFRVTVHSDIGARRVECDASPAPEVTVSFVETGSLSVIVRGLKEYPRRQHLVMELAWPDPGTGTARRAGESDIRDGRVVEFPVVQPGDYAFVIKMRFPWIGHELLGEILRVPVTVGGRNQALRATLPPLHSLGIRRAPQWFHLERLDSPVWKVALPNGGTTGLQRLEGLPGGRYRATSAGRSIDFTLPESSEVDFGTN